MKGLKLLRVERGLSQGEVEELTGIPQPKVSLIERGLKATPEELEKLEKILVMDRVYDRENSDR